MHEGDAGGGREEGRRKKTQLSNTQIRVIYNNDIASKQF